MNDPNVFCPPHTSTAFCIKQEEPEEWPDGVGDEDLHDDDDDDVFPENKVKVELLEPGPDDIVECTTCEVKFVNSYELKIHNMIHSGDHNCIICKEYVKNKFQFIGHVRKHMCAKPFLCPEPECDKTFPNARETKLHQRVHSDERPYMCTECGKAFKQINTLKDHEVVHTGIKRYKCKICEGAFATATSLRRHIRVMHETVRSYKCHFCEENFTSKQALKQHVAIHKDIDPLKCQLCGEKLTDEEEFTRHKNIHIDLKQSGYCEYCANSTFYFGLKDHIEKMHKARNCEICSLVFYDDKSMDNHRRSHLEEEAKEEYVCHICSKQFEFPRYLKAHLKRHDDNYKKFKCDLCDKTFSSRRDLNDHLLVHADVKNYKCKICDKAFRTKQSVNKHMPIHSDKRPFQCKLCPKRFKKQSILRKHLISHSRIRPYKCEMCDKSYKSKESLRVHRFTHRKSKYECKGCAVSFYFFTVYRKHKCFAADAKRKKCRICRRVFIRTGTYTLHCLGHEKSGSKCEICGVKFRYDYSRRLHELRHKHGVKTEREVEIKPLAGHFVSVKCEPVENEVLN